MLTSAETGEVTLTFADGAEHVLAVKTGQSVLDAGLAAGLPLLHQCRSGSCSSCHARLVSGQADHRAGAGSSLTPVEKAEGLRLLCMTEPQGACRFTLDYDSKVGENRPVVAQSFVNSVERVATDVVRLELELAEGCWMTFRPGQFINVKVPGTDAVRSYSMATTPADLPRIELFIRILPGGVMSNWLENRAAPDDVVTIEGPFGAFFLKDKVRAPHVMIGGGTGLAPMLSMIDALRATPGKKPRVLLSFGCQTPEGLFALDRLELRGHWLPQLETRVSVDRGEVAHARTGNPVAAITAHDALPPDAVAYLCGPPGMIAAARVHLEGLGLSSENIFAEHFTASGT